MLRFVDLSYAYWTDPVGSGSPLCAFLWTSDDGTFIKWDDSNQQIFSSLEEISDPETVPKADLRDRMLKLVPPGFFQGNTCVAQEQKDLQCFYELLKFARYHCALDSWGALRTVSPQCAYAMDRLQQAYYSLEADWLDQDLKDYFSAMRSSRKDS